MDIGAEISKKIQMAITAKLKELDAYVDDELPDYIMIMVANKKTEAQMTEALSLFLSENTKTFTSWLHKLLTTLRKTKAERKMLLGATADKAIEKTHLNQESSTPKDDAGKSKPADHSEESDRKISRQTKSSMKYKPETNNFESSQSEAVITINPEHGDTLDDELLAGINPLDCQKNIGKSKEAIIYDGKSKDSVRYNAYKSKSDSKNLKRKLSGSIMSPKHRDEGDDKKRSSSKRSVKISNRSSKHNNPPSKQDSSARQHVGTDENRSSKSSSKRKHRRAKVEYYSESESDDGSKSKKIKSSLSSTVNQITHESEFISEDESEEELSNSKVSSHIAYPKRKMTLPLDKQANRSLFVKAVSAAEKSVKRKGPVILTRREVLPQPAKVQTISDSNADKVDKPNVGHSLHDEKDERKILIRKAVGEVLYSKIMEDKRRRKSVLAIEGNKEGDECVTKERVLARKAILKEKENKKTLPMKTRKVDEKMANSNESSPEVKERQAMARDKRSIAERDSTSSESLLENKWKQPAGTSGKTEDRNKHCSDEKEVRKRNFPHDERKFIVTTTNDSEHTAAVKFDSRHATQNSEDKTIIPLRRKLRLLPRRQLATVSTKDSSCAITTQMESPQKPDFIVTLDSVGDKCVRSKTKENQEVNKTKQFRCRPETTRTNVAKSPTLIKMKASTSIKAKKPVPVKKQEMPTNITSTMAELKKMKRKMVEICEESNKLKQMQIKLAAVQAQKISPVVSPTPVTSSPFQAEQKSIYIGNVHYSTSEKQLSDYFSICGKIVRATILKDGLTGHPKGFAYLEFDDKRAVSSALALNNTQLNNRMIRVTLKQPNPGTLLVSHRASYSAPKPYRRPYRGRAVARSYRFSHSLSTFGQFSSNKMSAKNKTWINPSIAQPSK